MKRTAMLLCLSMVILVSVSATRAEILKVLWCTGGCCHDYAKNAPLLTEKMKQYASADFTIVTGLNIFKKANYADSYDAVVYDLCYASEKSKELIGNVVGTIKKGKPTVIIHCSLHTFRDINWDDWRQAMGMTSKRHDGFRAIKTKKTTEHPITKFWPEDWETPGEELYQCIKFWDSSTALMTAYSVQSEKDHPVTWINQYGKGKVFATTLGHNMLTVAQDDYHHLLANGLLWVVGKLDDEGNPAKGYQGKGKE